MKRYLLLLGILVGVFLTGESLVTASLQENKESQEQAKLQSQAKITMDQARETALKRAPGKIESGELEREHGKLVYSFDIRKCKGHDNGSSGQCDQRQGRARRAREQAAGSC